jgi:hypothetical protein
LGAIARRRQSHDAKTAITRGRAKDKDTATTWQKASTAKEEEKKKVEPLRG